MGPATGRGKTKPISPCGTGIPSASLSGQALPVDPNPGRDAHATIGRSGDRRSREGQSCQTKPIRPPVPGSVAQTNPIRREQQEEQVLGGKRVMVYWTYTRPRPNKANLPGRTEMGVGQPSDQRCCRLGLLRQTKPFPPGRVGRDLRDETRPIVRHRLDAPPRETNPICEEFPV